MRKFKTIVIFIIFCSLISNAQEPIANAGNDTLFCGNCGYLNAIPSEGLGTWTTPTPQYVSFADIHDPNTQVCSNIYNAGNETYPFFLAIWTEATDVIADSDTVKLRFAAIPNSDFATIPPKCNGEPATVKAIDETLPEYMWSFNSANIHSALPENSNGGVFHYLIYWNNPQTMHEVSLITKNEWGCESIITTKNIYEPANPSWNITVIDDECLQEAGQIIIGDTLQSTVFYWINENVGPPINSPVTAVNNLPGGIYKIRARYNTPNQQWYTYYISVFGDAHCTDTINVEVQPIEYQLQDINICLITVTENNKNQIVWNKNNYPELDTFFVYRKSEGPAIFEKIGSVSANQNSSFIDNNSSPHNLSYNYTISSYGLCLPLQHEDNALQSVSLKINEYMTDKYELNWNTQMTENIETVSVYRGSSPDNMILLTSLTATQNQFIDVEAISGFVYYKLEFILINPCSSEKTYSLFSSNIATNNTDYYSGVSDADAVLKFINIYPNPASEHLNIQTRSKILNVEIIDNKGSVVFIRQDETVSNIDISDFKTGIYYVKISLEDRILIEKLIIE